MKRGEFRGRIDPTYNLPMYKQIVSRLENAVTTIPFGSIIESISGGATPLRANDEQYCDSGIKFLRIQNITPLGFDFSDIKYITEIVHNNLFKRSQLQENDLLMTITGRIGTCAVVNKDCLPANINQHIVRIRLKKGYDPYFVANFLNSDIGLLLSNRGVTGTTRIALDYESIRQIPFPDIDINKQYELNKKMGNALRQKNKKFREANNLLSEISPLILRLLGITIPKYSSKLCSAVKSINLIQDKTFSAAYYHPERLATISCMKELSLFNTAKLSDVVYFIRNIVNSSESEKIYLGLSGVESHTGELTSAEDEVAGQAFEYQTGDVLYGRLRPYLNKVLYTECSGICSTEFHVMRIKNKNILLPEFLAEIMRSDLILSQTKHMMTGNTHPRISNDDVKNLYIPVPDVLLQRQIIEKIHNIKKESRALKKEAEQQWQDAKKQFEKELIG